MWETNEMLKEKFMIGYFLVPGWRSRKIHRIISAEGDYFSTACGNRILDGKCGYHYHSMIFPEDGTLCSHCFGEEE